MKSLDPREVFGRALVRRIAVVAWVVFTLMSPSVSTANTKVTLTWWLTGGATPTQVQIYNHTAERFMARFPNVHVEIVQIPGGWDAAWEQLLVAAAAGVPPDLVVRLKDYMVLDLAHFGLAMPLDAFIQRDREAMKIDPYYESLFATFSSGRTLLRAQLAHAPSARQRHD